MDLGGPFRITTIALAISLTACGGLSGDPGPECSVDPDCGPDQICAAGECIGFSCEGDDCDDGDRPGRPDGTPPEECPEGACCDGDAVASAGTVCRAAVGVCDVAETCDGVSAGCPADQLATGTMFSASASDLSACASSLASSTCFTPGGNQVAAICLRSTPSATAVGAWALGVNETGSGFGQGCDSSGNPSCTNCPTGTIETCFRQYAP